MMVKIEQWFLFIIDNHFSAFWLPCIATGGITPIASQVVIFSNLKTFYLAIIIRSIIVLIILVVIVLFVRNVLNILVVRVHRRPFQHGLPLHILLGFSSRSAWYRDWGWLWWFDDNSLWYSSINSFLFSKISGYFDIFDQDQDIVQIIFLFLSCDWPEDGTGNPCRRSIWVKLHQQQ